MKTPLLSFSLLLAAAATAVLCLVLLRERPGAPGGPEAPEVPPVPPDPLRLPPAEELLRPYETTVTLTEDLRDALAGPPEALAAELARVSRLLGTRARWTLEHAAPEEASPKVRALLVHAAGVHVPDEEILLRFLSDREPVVRRAAALAAARAEGGTRRHALLEGVEVAVGRRLPEGTRRALEERLRSEEDEGVRGALAAALGTSPAPSSPPR